MPRPLSGQVEDPRTRALYLDMVARGVTHSLYGKLDQGLMKGNFGPKNRALGVLVQGLRLFGLEPIRLVPDSGGDRDEGKDRPVFAQTLIGRRRLANVRACAESVVSEGIPGDLIECGVWRGGAGIMMRAVLEAYGVHDRRVWMADSFAGLPRPQSERYPADANSAWHKIHEFAVPIDEVRDNFRHYGLLDERVEFLEGWFSDTLPSVADRTWSVIRVDADMYGSTFEALDLLYPSLAPGGYLIVDDYTSIDSTRRAVDDYRRAHDIRESIERIDWTGVYWRRGPE